MSIRCIHSGQKIGFLSKLKTKYHQKVERKYIISKNRRQFNLSIDEEIIEAVKLLATALEVPKYVITEHLLQVDTYQVLEIIKDSDNRQKLQKHLVINRIYLEYKPESLASSIPKVSISLLLYKRSWNPIYRHLAYNYRICTFQQLIEYIT